MQPQVYEVYEVYKVYDGQVLRNLGATYTCHPGTFFFSCPRFSLFRTFFTQTVLDLFLSFTSFHSFLKLHHEPSTSITHVSLAQCALQGHFSVTARAERYRQNGHYHWCSMRLLSDCRFMGA